MQAESIPMPFFTPHTTSTALAEKNMIRSNSAPPPYCRYKQIMAYLNSSVDLAADQTLIDTGVQTHHSPGDP
jgi:hypothetical protein